MEETGEIPIYPDWRDVMNEFKSKRVALRNEFYRLKSVVENATSKEQIDSLFTPKIFFIMRREHILGSKWNLIIDCPLNNSLIDQSGNNNHLTAVSGGTPVFITDPTDSNIKVGQFNTDVQGLILPINTIDFINICRIN